MSNQRTTNSEPVSRKLSSKKMAPACCMLAAMALSFLPFQAKAGNEPDADLYVGYQTIEGEIKTEIVDYLKTQGWDVSDYVKVVSTKKSATTLRITLSLYYKSTTFTVPVSVYFDMEFGCPFSSNEDLIMIKNVGTSITGNLSNTWINTIKNALNTMIKNKTQAIVGQMEDAIKLISGILNSKPYLVCPHYAMMSESGHGSFFASIDFTAGCVDGRTKTVPCPSNMIGTGTSYKCDNGLWQRTAYNCEPVGPTGIPY